MPVPPPDRAPGDTPAEARPVDDEATGTAFAWRRIAVPAYGPTLLSAAATGAVIPVAALRAAELGASIGLAAFVVALTGVGQLLGALPSGAMVARLGERRTLVVAGVADVVALTVAGLAPTLWLMAAALLLSGLATSAFFLARQGFMIDVLPTHRVARGMSLLGGSLRAGLLLGPAAGGVGVAVLGNRGAYLVAALFALGSLVVVVLSPDLTGAHEAERATDEAPTGVLAVARRHVPLLLTQGLGIMVIQGLRQSRVVILPLWALHLGLDGVVSSGIFVAAAVAELLLVYPGGWLMDRLGRGWVVAPVMVLMSAGFLLLPLAGSAAGLLGVAIVMALGNGLGSGVVMTLGADAAPVLDRGQFLGAWRFCGEVGNAGSTLGLSAVTAAVSLPAAALALGALGLVGWGWMSLWVGRADRDRSARRGRDQA